MAIKQSTIPITIRISEEALALVSAGIKATPVAEALGSQCSQFVEAMAHGGMMLSGDHVREIENNHKRSISTARDVIKATEGAAHKEDGRSKYSFTIDPAFEPRLLERASEIGRTPGELMRDTIDFAIEQEWVYGISTGDRRRAFTNQQEDELKALLGKDDFTVADIIAGLKARAKRTSKEPELIEA